LVVVSVHHNHASGLIKIYQGAGGVFRSIVFSGAYTWGIRFLFLKYGIEPKKSTQKMFMFVQLQIFLGVVLQLGG
jgi:hypothetical protein